MNPSSLERQNVSPVLGILNDKTVEALLSKSDHAARDTAEFNRIILSWWKIKNIKSCNKGVRLCDHMCLPFCDVDDDRLRFLQEFIHWLQIWNRDKVACLTIPTFRALLHSTKTMHNLIIYAKNSLHLDYRYFLPGKVQSDNLERRFGLYRQLCGAIMCLLHKC